MNDKEFLLLEATLLDALKADAGRKSSEYARMALYLVQGAMVRRLNGGAPLPRVAEGKPSITNSPCAVCGKAVAPSVMQDERRAFEAWWKKHGNVAIGKTRTEDACWMVWQARAAPTLANVAQGAEAFPYQKTFNAIAAATSISGGHVAISVDKFVEAFAAPPAQVAVTDDARDSIIEAMARAMNMATDGHDRYWSGYLKSAEAAFDAALTAAQSASEGNHAG